MQYVKRLRPTLNVSWRQKDGCIVPQLAKGRDVRKHQRQPRRCCFQNRKAKGFVKGGGHEDTGLSQRHRDFALGEDTEQVETVHVQMSPVWPINCAGSHDRNLMQMCCRLVQQGDVLAFIPQPSHSKRTTTV